MKTRRRSWSLRVNSAPYRTRRDPATDWGRVADSDPLSDRVRSVNLVLTAERFATFGKEPWDDIVKMSEVLRTSYEAERLDDAKGWSTTEELPDMYMLSESKIDCLAYNGTSMQKGQIVPTVRAGSRLSRLRMANEIQCIKPYVLR